MGGWQKANTNLTLTIYFVTINANVRLKWKETLTMKKLKYQFCEIEVPDDFPDKSDGKNLKDYFRAMKQYADEHPDVADRVIREYETAYWEWMKNKEIIHAQAEH